ncbi:MAG: hypothetical protein IPM64_17235 [Phycisphaerales bacterium]|nr:hypothetical protein [Phycisphaerales bacterium]
MSVALWLVSLALFVGLMIALGGCTAAHDVAILQARTAYHAAVDGHARGLQAMQEELLERIARQNTELQRALVEVRSARFLDRHTDDDGGLVSRDAAGNIVPMPREQLEAFLADRDAQLRAATEQSRAADAVVQQFRAGREQLIAVTARLAAREIQWQEAKATAQAELDRVLTAIGSLAAGIGAGVVVAP